MVYYDLLLPLKQFLHILQFTQNILTEGGNRVFSVIYCFSKNLTFKIYAIGGTLNEKWV